MTEARTFAGLLQRVEAVCVDADLVPSVTMFSARTTPDAVRSKSFQVIPATFAYEANGADNELRATLSIVVAYRADGREKSTFQHQIARDAERLIAYMQRMGEMSPEAVNCTVEPSEDDRFLLLTVKPVFYVCVQRV